MWRPSGARLGSTTHGWASSTKGRSGWRPARTSASERATSSKVPPTWTVTVRRHASAAQGTGPLRAQSTLQVPGPGLKRAQGRPARRVTPAAGRAGGTGGATYRAGRPGPVGSSSSAVIGCAVCTVPPRRRSSAARPWVIAALPPSTTGQPAPWPSAVSSSPKDAVSGARQRLHGVGRRAGQEGPGRVRREALGQVADRGHAGPGEAGQGQRVARDAAHRGEHVGHDPVEPFHQRPHQLRVVRGVATEVRGRLVDVTVEGGGPAAIERMGEGQLGLAQADAEGPGDPASGRTERPPAPGGRRSTRRGRTRAASAPRCGCHRRWSVRPSNTSTPTPARANVSAAASPLGPDPTTTASTGSMDRRYGTRRPARRRQGVVGSLGRSASC